MHDTTDAIAPQFVRAQPADVGCFNNNRELARYIERGVLADVSDRPAARRITGSVAFASYLMAMAPTVLVYLFSQRWVISGLTQGAVKQ
ncbi:hypothetical protein ACOKM3_40455 [Streptomyces sp. BH106]|uniref:hypothetical protein n=1 Tax=Streptomyces sp. BH106 TaxID=3410409 RepID=UPI003CE92B8B